MKFFRAVLILAIATTAVAAQGRGRGRGGDDSPPPGKVRDTYGDRDRDSDSRVIVAWYKDHPAEHPGRGRGRGHTLPPGWEKKVVRSQAIPVEYREYVEPVPAVLVRTLPPVRPGWEFVMISNRVVLINRPTWMVIDVVVTL